MPNYVNKRMIFLCTCFEARERERERERERKRKKEMGS